MKVRNVNNMALETVTKSESHEIDELQSKDVVFKSQLSKEKGAAYMGHVKELISQIEEQGKLLGKRADMGELQKYREMVTKLINETVSNGFIFEKEGKIGVNGRSKIFAMIRTINEKLDKMTQKLLQDEQKNLNLLDDVDDIRGLLVDMYF